MRPADTSPTPQRPQAAIRFAARTAQLGAAAAAGLALLALLAGVPYGLAHWLGWPLPTHWPSRTQWQDTLSHPLTNHTLLNALACICWVTWALFAVDVVRALPDVMRHTGPPPTQGRLASPLRAVAAVLLGAFIAGLITTRTTTTALVGLHQAPATTPNPPVTRASTTRLATPTYVTTSASLAVPSETTTVVQPPRDGIHDSLWRIAERTLGDGNRWPEIFALNLNRPQPGGDTLTSPNLIKPGWTLLLPIPATTNSPNAPAVPPTSDAPTTPTAPAAANPPSLPEPPTSLPAPASTSAPAPLTDAPPSPLTQPAATATPTAPEAHNGIDLDDGVYVSAAVAAAVSAGLLARRRRNRRSYLPGSGRRDDLLPVAPLIRNLHLAHLRATTPAEKHAGTQRSDDAVDQEDDRSRPPAATPSQPSVDDRPPFASTSHDVAQPTPPPNVELSTATLALAHHGGIGLIGPGAAGATRALLLELTAKQPGHETADVLITAATLAALLPDPHGSLPLPRHLHVVADLDTALNQLETITLHRARAAMTEDTGRPLTSAAPITLFADVGADTSRLQAVLDNGTAIGIGAVLLGQWRAGATAHIDLTGAVTAANPVAASTLRGARLSTIPGPDASALMRVLTVPVDSDQPAEPTTSRAAPLSLMHGNEHDSVHGTDNRGGAPITTNHGQAARPDGVASTLQLRVLGPPLLSWTSPQTAEEVPIPLGPRQRELLVLLALHPDGITRERIADTLWPDAAPERPFNALHTTLTRLRRNVAAATGATHTEVTRAEGARYHLDRRVIDTDYWAFADAVADRHCANTDEDRLLSSRRIIGAYRGELGDGIDAEWLEAPREAVRRDALDAASLVAQFVLAEDPQQALDAYEAAQRIDPYNEQIYRHLMMVQARLARPDAIDRTLALLRTRLSEIDEGPDPKTLALADRLRQEATSSDLSAPRADAAIAGIR